MRPFCHMSNREIAAELAYWDDKWTHDVFYLEHYLLLRAERAERIGRK